MNELSSSLLTCPHCGNQTPHQLIFTHTCPTVAYENDGSLYEGGAPDTIYRIFECSTCRDISVYSSLDCGDEENLAYPSGFTIDKSVPEVVASNFREAKRVQKVSPNAYAVLIRRALEALCDDRGVSAGSLHSRLEQLSQRGDIPPVLAQMTSVLRTLGNSGAHNTRQKVTVPLTWQMEKFFNTLIEYIYVAPARLAEFRRALDRSHGDDEEG
jgi:hypothetical protein